MIKLEVEDYGINPRYVRSYDLVTSLIFVKNMKRR